MFQGYVNYPSNEAFVCGEFPQPYSRVLTRDSKHLEDHDFIDRVVKYSTVRERGNRVRSRILRRRR